jgi:hypothetical protein
MRSRYFSGGRCSQQGSGERVTVSSVAYRSRSCSHARFAAPYPSALATPPFRIAFYSLFAITLSLVST